METPELKNALIKSAEITIDECGFLTSWIHLDYGSTCQGFGNDVLYLPRSFKNHELKTMGGHFIFRCMEIAGVSKWSEMIGRPIRVKASDERVIEIGHFIKDDWFNPTKDFKEGYSK